MSLEMVRTDLGDCQRCRLHEGRRNIVFGAGNPKAKLVFVGEAPGQEEDFQGLPFVGRAGQLLTKMIQAMGLSREEVYIANIIKCRPPQNRNPMPDESKPFQFGYQDVAYLELTDEVSPVAAPHSRIKVADLFS